MMRFPWDALMHVGFGRLRLAPRDFWAMTLRELYAALGARAPMRRDDLNELLEKYPDHGG